VKVRDAIELIGDDGWIQVATRGSHRQFKHPVKPCRIWQAVGQLGVWGVKQHIEASGP